MNKSIKYSIEGALLIGCGNALINLINQLNKKRISEEINWNELLISFGKGALVGATAGFVIGSIKDQNQINIILMAGGSANYIKDVLGNYENNSLVLARKAEKLQNLLNNSLKNLITSTLPSKAQPQEVHQLRDQI